MSEAQVLVNRTSAQRANPKPESAGAHVTIYCKLPTGMFLQAYRMVEQRVQVMGGGVREEHIAEPVGLPVKINGNRTGRLGDPARHAVIGDFGVTHGVSKDLWDQWLDANKDQPYVVNGLIFASEKGRDGEDEAHDRRDTFTGLEPMAKDGDPRAPSAGANLSGIKDERET